MGVHTLINAAVALGPASSKYTPTIPPDSNLDIRPGDHESGHRPLLTMTLPEESSGHTHTHSIQSYGATSGVPSSARGSPETLRRGSNLGRVPEEGTAVEDEEDEEDSEEVEWDLEERGFYGGSYKRTVALYCIVPITSLLAFILLAILPTLLWPTEQQAPPSYPRYFPSPLPELLVSGSLWSLSHLIRVPLYNFMTSLISWPIIGTLLFHVIYVFLNQLLRLSSFPILRIRHQMVCPLPTFQDPAFLRVWWISLGWAAVEVAVGIAQGYEQIALYREVMVPEDEVRQLLQDWRNGGSSESSAIRNEVALPEEILPLSPRLGQAQNGGASAESAPNGTNANGRRKRSPQLEDAIRSVIDKDMEQLVHLKERDELEDLYGIPVIRIPVFVSCLLRIDSFVLSLGLTLILGAAYLRSPISFPKEPLPPIYTNNAFLVTFPVVVLIYLFLALLHTPPVLPRIGVHSTAYIGLLLGLGSVFAGLGLWGALS